jgi:hypothetical protein
MNWDHIDHVLPTPPRRFVTEAQLREMLELFRMTACGTTNWRPTKHGRMLRTVEMFEERNGKVPGAYKDLDAALSNYTPLLS